MLYNHGTAYFWKSLANATYPSGAVWMIDNILPEMKVLDASNIPIVGVVSDNAAVNTKFYNLLIEHPKFSHIIRVPCFAHIIQLYVNALLKLPGIKEVILFMIKIINAFQNNGEYRQKLRVLQVLEIEARKDAIAAEREELSQRYNDEVEDIEVITNNTAASKTTHSKNEGLFSLYAL